MDLDKRLESLRAEDPETYWTIEFIVRMLEILRESQPYCDVDNFKRLQEELRSLLIEVGIDPYLLNSEESTSN